VLNRLQPESATADYWLTFFDAVANGTTRVWISIAAVSIVDILKTPNLTLLGIIRISHQSFGHTIVRTS
jgi:hypothetical protein